MILGIIIALGIIWLWLIYEWRRSPSYEDVWGDDLFTLDDEDEEYNPLRYEDDNEDLSDWDDTLNDGLEDDSTADKS
jgi:hypothetical protein